jgi:hypothetical protein
MPTSPSLRPASKPNMFIAQTPPYPLSTPQTPTESSGSNSTLTKHWHELKRIITALINARFTSPLTQSRRLCLIRGLLIRKYFTLQLGLFSDSKLFPLHYILFCGFHCCIFLYKRELQKTITRKLSSGGHQAINKIIIAYHIVVILSILPVSELVPVPAVRIVGRIWREPVSVPLACDVSYYGFDAGCQICNSRYRYRKFEVASSDEGPPVHSLRPVLR